MDVLEEMKSDSVDDELEIEADEAYKNVIKKKEEITDEFNDDEFAEAFKSSFKNKDLPSTGRKEEAIVHTDPGKTASQSEAIPGAPNCHNSEGESKSDTGDRSTNGWVYLMDVSYMVIKNIKNIQKDCLLCILISVLGAGAIYLGDMKA